MGVRKGRETYLFFFQGAISAIVFAVILVVLHIAFIVIYLYRVKFKQLDGDWR